MIILLKKTGMVGGRILRRLYYMYSIPLEIF